MFEKLDETQIRDIFDDVVNILDPSKMEVIKSPIFKNSDTYHTERNVVVLSLPDNEYHFQLSIDGRACYVNLTSLLPLPDKMSNFFELDNMTIINRNLLEFSASLYPKDGYKSIFDLRYSFDQESWDIVLSSNMAIWLQSRKMDYESMDETDWMICFFDMRGD